VPCEVIGIDEIDPKRTYRVLFWGKVKFTPGALAELIRRRALRAKRIGGAKATLRLVNLTRQKLYKVTCLAM
jgi:hypothetical protein